MSNRNDLPASEHNLLDYVLATHRTQAGDRRHAYVALLLHAHMLSVGGKLCDADGSPQPNSVLSENWASNDLIQLSYKVQNQSPGSDDMLVC